MRALGTQLSLIKAISRQKGMMVSALVRDALITFGTVVGVAVIEERHIRRRERQR